MKLGSLFDGSGGFPLAGAIHGITPVWASEIEPYPIKVTKARFPGMKHLGSVLDVNGAEVEPVDIITFGSPCQDLSVAGKQAGLHKGERSNLFFEAIRIIKEMREATNGKYPRIAVWENVPGAYSSNKGEDFRAVLEAFCSVKDETADVPRPAAGKWNPAGAIVGNGWSVAWRTFDAQFWGVPQRRKRIYLIADFGSERAGEVLFEPQGLPGDSAQSGEKGQGTAGDAEGSVRGSGGIGINGCIAGTLDANYFKGCGLRQGVEREVVCYPAAYAERGAGRSGVYAISGKQQSLATSECLANTLGANDYKEPQSVCYPIDSHQQDSRFKVCDDGISPTLPGQMGTGGNNGPMVLEAYTAGNGQMNQPLLKEQARTLDCMHDQQIVIKPSKPPRKYIIRRLTPLECCRLQGFPDWWEDGVQGSDSARYKMWGNGIALPNAAHVVGCAIKLIQGQEKQIEEAVMANQCVICGQEMPEGDQVCGYCRRQHGY